MQVKIEPYFRFLKERLMLIRILNKTQDTKLFYMRIYPYQLIRIIFFLMLGFGVTQSQCQEELNVLKSWFQYDNSDNSLYPHLTNEAYKLLNKRAQKVKKIVELNDWEKRQSK